MALFLSDYLGGPNVEFTLAAKTSRSIFRLKQQCHDRFISPDAASLDIVFEYPGTISRPEFEGMKQGKYSKKQRKLQLWVAVPERMLNSVEFADFYFESLEATLNYAKQKFESSQIAFPLEEYHSLILEMAKRYREQAAASQ